MKTKPFLKWAGGKTQLINDIREQIPKRITDRSFTYIEPFVGSGAVLFWILQEYPNIEEAIINDINTDLINSYISIKYSVLDVIEVLELWESEYHSIAYDEERKKDYYYQKRELFNNRTSERNTQSALFIFLNKTCFNGLYRVNRNNKFNVPIGSYKTPQICNKSNLLAVSKLLQKVTILNGDYSDTLAYSTVDSLFYLDPPYKPLSDTSSFNSYSKDEFDDAEQIRLKHFCDALNEKGCQWVLSNSDVKSKNPNDDFFDTLYSDFKINRVSAKRSINANPAKRGKLTELLITN
jgi:DNA adenine methylase